MALIDGRVELGEEIRQSSLELQNFVGTVLQFIASQKIIRHILPGLFLSPDASSRYDRFHKRVASMNCK